MLRPMIRVPTTIIFLLICQISLASAEDIFDREREAGVQDYLKEKKEREAAHERAREVYVKSHEHKISPDASADQHEEHELELLSEHDQERKNYAEKMEARKKEKSHEQNEELQALGLADKRGRNPVEKRNLLGKKGEVSQVPTAVATSPPNPNAPQPGASGAGGAPGANFNPSFPGVDAGNGAGVPPQPYDVDPNNPAGGGGGVPGDAYPYNPNDPSYVPPPPIDEYPPPYFDDEGY